MKLLRDLKSYKSRYYGLARAKGVLLELIAAKTLTEARRILFGERKK